MSMNMNTTATMIHRKREKKSKRMTGSHTDDNTCLPHLPQDIIYSDILPRLPVKSLFRFTSVSKSWNATIVHPSFLKSHWTLALQNSTSSLLAFFCLRSPSHGDADEEGCTYYFITGKHYLYVHEYARSKLVSHSNGLFCFLVGHCLKIFNPSTREILFYRLPPRPPRHHPHISYGFGFDPLCSQYKLVQIVHADRGFYRCMVCTLGSHHNSSSWRQIAVPFNPTPDDNGIEGTIDSGRPTFINGTLYWFLLGPHLVMAFDLHNESFNFFEGPCPAPCIPFFFREPDPGYFLTELQGGLCLAFQNEGILHIWKYNQSIRSHWEDKMYYLPHKSIPRVGVLGAESLLYSLTAQGIMVYSMLDAEVYLFYPNRYRSNQLNLVPSSMPPAKKFPHPSQGLFNPSSVTECLFIYHVENILPLKGLLGPHVKYMKLGGSQN